MKKALIIVLFILCLIIILYNILQNNTKYHLYMLEKGPLSEKVYAVYFIGEHKLMEAIPLLMKNIDDDRHFGYKSKVPESLSCHITYTLGDMTNLDIGNTCNAGGGKSKEEMEGVINKWKIWYKTYLIEQDKNYKTKILANEEFMKDMTDGGGELTGYFKDGKIDKIEERIVLSYGVIIYKYYFEDEKLIYIYNKEEYFPYIEETGGFDYNNLENGFEGNYYYDDSGLIKEDIIGQQRFGGMREVSYFIESARQNIELLKTK